MHVHNFDRLAEFWATLAQNDYPESIGVRWGDGDDETTDPYFFIFDKATHSVAEFRDRAAEQSIKRIQDSDAEFIARGLSKGGLTVVWLFQTFHDPKEDGHNGVKIYVEELQRLIGRDQLNRLRYPKFFGTEV